jgi:hypothetical protein
MSDIQMSRSAELQSSLFSPRTAKYVATMKQEGEEFNYRRWLRRVREEEAQAKQVAAAFSSGDYVAPELGDLTNTLDRLDAWANAEPALHAKSAQIPRVVCRSNHNASRERSEDRLGRRLMSASDAFDEFQESRVRDAVYVYLKAVFAIVVDHNGRRRTKRLLQRTFQFAGLPVDKNADPFAAVIRCTSERDVDNKTISKWARALRYAAYCKRPRTKLRAFIKKMGGLNACADRHAIYLGRDRR